MGLDNWDKKYKSRFVVGEKIDDGETVYAEISEIYPEWRHDFNGRDFFVVCGLNEKGDENIGGDSRGIRIPFNEPCTCGRDVTGDPLHSEWCDVGASYWDPENPPWA